MMRIVDTRKKCDKFRDLVQSSPLLSVADRIKILTRSHKLLKDSTVPKTGQILEKLERLCSVQIKIPYVANINMAQIFKRTFVEMFKTSLAAKHAVSFDIKLVPGPKLCDTIVNTKKWQKTITSRSEFPCTCRELCGFLKCPLPAPGEHVCIAIDETELTQTIPQCFNVKSRLAWDRDSVRKQLFDEFKRLSSHKDLKPLLCTTLKDKLIWDALRFVDSLNPWNEKRQVKLSDVKQWYS